MLPNFHLIKLSKTEPFLIFLAISKKKYKTEIQRRGLVWIAKTDKKFRKDYKQNYADEVFTVFKVAALRLLTNNLKDADNVISDG